MLKEKDERWWPIPVAPVRPHVAHDYGVSLFWSLVDQIGGTVQTISLRQEMVRLIREGAYAEAYLMALQHDYQRGHPEHFPLPPPGKTREQIAVEAEQAAIAPAQAAPPESPWRESED